jgi:hypothetical protein
VSLASVFVLVQAMTQPARVRDIDNDEGHQLLRIVQRDARSVVTWRPAQVVLLSAQGHGRCDYRDGDVHEPGPCPGCDPQLQR